MEKTAVILMGLCLIQSTSDSYALTVSDVGRAVVLMGLCAKTYDWVYSIVNASDELAKKQEKDVSIASKKLIDLLVKHANDKIGVLGLPESCEQAARELIILPNGLEEFKRVIGLYIKYLKDKGSSEFIEIKGV
jgi:hypothetical protein